jgi:hypothetical protein
MRTHLLISTLMQAVWVWMPKPLLGHITHPSHTRLGVTKIVLRKLDSKNMYTSSDDVPLYRVRGRIFLIVPSNFCLTCRKTCDDPKSKNPPSRKAHGSERLLQTALQEGDPATIDGIDAPCIPHVSHLHLNLACLNCLQSCIGESHLPPAFLLRCVRAADGMPGFCRTEAGSA